jgi:hypothetical protein
MMARSTRVMSTEDLHTTLASMLDCLQGRSPARVKAACRRHSIRLKPTTCITSVNLLETTALTIFTRTEATLREEFRHCVTGNVKGTRKPSERNSRAARPRDAHCSSATKLINVSNLKTKFPNVLEFDQLLIYSQFVNPHCVSPRLISRCQLCSA